MTTRPFTGIWPVAPTPFTDDGALDLEGMKRVIDCMVDQGVDGICILANFSEQFLLSDEERATLTRLCLEHAAGRVPVIVTVSHFATAGGRGPRPRGGGDGRGDGDDDAALPRGAAPRRRGGDLRALRPGRRRRAASRSWCRTRRSPATTLSVPFLARMAREIEEVRLFKIETPQAAAKLRALIAAGGDAIEGPFDGEEAITLMADLDAGATGTMTSATLPDLIGPAVTAYLAGDRGEATAIYNRLLPIINFENRQCGWRSCKVVMKEGGVIGSEHVRHPTRPLHPETRAQLLELAREVNPLALSWGR